MEPTHGGIKLRHYREGRGLSQAAFAALVGTNQSTVAKWEAGHFRPGRYATRAIERATEGAITDVDFFPDLAAAE